MGKLKNEMRKVHRKKIGKAKERLKEFEKGKDSYEKLNSAARRIFYKRLKAGYKFPVRLRSSVGSEKTSASE